MMIPHFYDFRCVDFKLPSRERLVKRLGDYDALAEFAVLSFRDFESNVNTSDNTIEFIRGKAKAHDVKISGVLSLDNYHEAMYKSFMVNTYAMFDEFLAKLKEDIRILIAPSYELVDVNGISDYERAKRSLNKIGIEPQIPLWLEQLEEYYRLVRNHVAHNYGDDEKCMDVYNKIDKNKMYDDYKVFEGLAPNPPGQITIHDFYLFSASVKHIANIITISLKGRINWRGIGKTHPLLTHRHPSGTDRRELARDLLIKYGHNYTKEELDQITADIRSQW